jgi:hypothetical protein
MTTALEVFKQAVRDKSVRDKSFAVWIEAVRAATIAQRPDVFARLEARREGNCYCLRHIVELPAWG